MPDRKTLERAARDKRQGKSASTQAGEFVREEIDHVREGKHGVRSSKQAIAIGLSKARRAGVKLPAPKKASAATKRKAEQDSHAAHDGHTKSATRAQATTKALKKESAKPASRAALSRNASKTAAKRTTRGPFCSCQEGRGHQGRGRQIGCRQEGGAHPGSEQAGGECAASRRALNGCLRGMDSCTARMPARQSLHITAARKGKRPAPLSGFEGPEALLQEFPQAPDGRRQQHAVDAQQVQGRRLADVARQDLDKPARTQVRQDVIARLVGHAMAGQRPASHQVRRHRPRGRP